MLTQMTDGHELPELQRSAANASAPEQNIGQRSCAQSAQRTPGPERLWQQGDAAREDHGVTVNAQNHFAHIAGPDTGQTQRAGFIPMQFCRPCSSTCTLKTEPDAASRALNEPGAATQRRT